MAGQQERLPDAVILTGASVSNIFRAKETYEDGDIIIVEAPAAYADAHTFVFETSMDEKATAASTWSRGQAGDPRVDMGLPPAGKTWFIYELAYALAFRVKDLTGNVTADTTWKLSKRFQYT